MLTITRSVGCCDGEDTVLIGTSDGVVRVVIQKIKGSKHVRIGVDAPLKCPIWRKELVPPEKMQELMTPFFIESLPPTASGVYRTADGRHLCSHCIEQEAKFGRINQLQPIDPVGGPEQVCQNMLSDNPADCASGINSVDMSLYS